MPSVTEQIRAQAEFIVSQAKVDGEGCFCLPGSPVPAPQKGDVQRNAYADYYQQAPSYACLGVQQAWIRRAVYAEAFAKALEAELEGLRQGGIGPNYGPTTR